MFGKKPVRTRSLGFGFGNNELSDDAPPHFNRSSSDMALDEPTSPGRRRGRLRPETALDEPTPPGLTKRARRAPIHNELQTALQFQPKTEEQKLAQKNKVTEITERLIQQGVESNNASLAIDGAVALRTLKSEHAEKALNIVAQLASKTGDAASLLKAANNLRIIGPADQQSQDNIIQYLVQAVTIAHRNEDVTTAFRSAEILIELGDPRLTTEVLKKNLLKVAALALAKAQPEFALKAVNLLRENGVPATEHLDIVTNAANAAFDQGDIETTLFAAEILLQDKNAEAPQALIKQIVTEVSKKIAVSGSAETLLRATEIYAELSDAEPLSLHNQLVNVAGRAQAQQDPETGLRAAGLLAEMNEAFAHESALAIANEIEQSVTKTRKSELAGLAASIMVKASTRLRLVNPALAWKGLKRAGELAFAQNDTEVALQAAQQLLKGGAEEQAAAGTIAAAVAATQIKNVEGAIASDDPEAVLDLAHQLVATKRIITQAGGDADNVQTEIIKLANALLKEVQLKKDDLAAVTSAVGVLKASGEDTMDLERKIAAFALERADKRVKAVMQGFRALDISGAITLLQTALETNPQLANEVNQVAEKMIVHLLGQKGLDDPALENVDLLEDAMYLRLNTRPDKDGVNSIVSLGTTIRKKAAQEKDQITVERYDHLLVTARSVLQQLDTPTAVTISLAGVANEFQDVSENIRSKITLAKKIGAEGEEITIVHYRSQATLDASQHNAVQSFAEVVAVKTQVAYKELLRGGLQHWEAGAQLNRLLQIRQSWDEAKKAVATLNIADAKTARALEKAIFYDLQKLNSIQSGEQLKKKPYNQDIAAHYEASISAETGAVKVTDFITARLDHHTSNSKDLEYAEGRAFNLLHAVAGYLIEERTYQLLPPKETAGWEDQDTNILGGGTRPDIKLTLAGTPTVALLDLTARNSFGHIFNKSPKWTESTKVGDSVEIMYPSFGQDLLVDLLFNAKTFTPEQVLKIQAEFKAKKAAEEEANKQRTAFVLTMQKNLVSATQFKEVVGAANAKHLLQAYGLFGTGKGFGDRVKTIDPKRVEEGFKNLLAEASKRGMDISKLTGT